MFEATILNAKVIDGKFYIGASSAKTVKLVTNRGRNTQEWPVAMAGNLAYHCANAKGDWYLMLCI